MDVSVPHSAGKVAHVPAEAPRRSAGYEREEKLPRRFDATAGRRQGGPTRAVWAAALDAGEHGIERVYDLDWVAALPGDPQVRPVEVTQGAPQAILQVVEQGEEPIVEAPRIDAQEPGQRHSVHPRVDVLVPQVAEEIAHVPIIADPYRQHPGEVEAHRNAQALEQQEEIVHVCGAGPCLRVVPCRVKEDAAEEEVEDVERGRGGRGPVQEG